MVYEDRNSSEIDPKSLLAPGFLVRNMGLLFVRGVVTLWSRLNTQRRRGTELKYREFALPIPDCFQTDSSLLQTARARKLWPVCGMGRLGGIFFFDIEKKDYCWRWSSSLMFFLPTTSTLNLLVCYTSHTLSSISFHLYIYRPFYFATIVIFSSHT